MKPNTHGGPRPGSGRKKSGRKPYLVRMKPQTAQAIRTRAQANALRTIGEQLEKDYGS